MRVCRYPVKDRHPPQVRWETGRTETLVTDEMLDDLVRGTHLPVVPDSIQSALGRCMCVCVCVCANKQSKDL